MQTSSPLHRSEGNEEAPKGSTRSGRSNRFRSSKSRRSGVAFRTQMASASCLRRTGANAVALNELRSPIDSERRQRRRRGIVPQGGAVVRRNESEITAFRLMKHVMNRDV